MKRGIVAGSLLLSFFLTGCFGGDDSETNSACSDPYKADAFSVCLPSGWNVLTKEELLKSGLPEDVAAAFQGEAPISGQFPIVTVTSEILREAMGTKDYSKASIASVETLPGYEVSDRRRVQVSGEDAEIHIFHAQPTPDAPLQRFYQVSAASNGIGYTFTAALPVASPKEAEEGIIGLLESVTLSSPEREE